MKTIEEIYAEMFEEHENVMAARRQERIAAANPYGCNQYGHRKGHGSSSSGGGSAGSNKQSEPEKKSEPETKSDSKPNEKTVSLQEQLEQARQEAIDLVRKGKAHTPEHSAALGKLHELEKAYEEEKKKERIEKYKKEKEQNEKERQRLQQKKRKKELEELHEEQSLFGYY